MNRKGNIGTALMPLLALILFVNALFVMNGFNEDFSKKKSELRILSDKSSTEHELIELKFKEAVLNSISASNGSLDFESSFKSNLSSFAEVERVSGLNTNLYGKLANGEYSLISIDDRYELLIFDVFENYGYANNELKYAYSVKIIFDEMKVISFEKIYGIRASH